MKKNLICVIMVFFLISMISVIDCYAITEAEVQAAVTSSSKETVSGNILVWFLCAIAFMKVSQKIDSFMGALGITVGKTGGSMMAEVMVVGRAIGSAFKSGGKFAGFGKRGSSSGGGSSPAGTGGILGGIGQKMSEGAAGAVTGNATSSGGIVQSFGKNLDTSSTSKFFFKRRFN